jgi:hypothetical protein
MDSPAAADAAHSINLIQRLAANMAYLFHGYSIPQFVTFKSPDIMLTAESSEVSRFLKSICRVLQNYSFF